MATLNESRQDEPSGHRRTREIDLELESKQNSSAPEEHKESAFKNLSWLDRLLALWILLAMIIGILLGNFVPNVSHALHKGEFVNVSVPIGELYQ